jgi:NAD(P) transhydrogenase subunit alpha
MRHLRQGARATRRGLAYSRMEAPMRRLAMVLVMVMAALMVFSFARSVFAQANAPLPVAPALAAPAAEEAPAPALAFENLYIFILAGFVGFEVIARVSPTLHTPLMSATNAISGISLVGSIVAAGARYSTLSTILGTIAVAAATTNVVGGFMITDRMLRMFKRKDRGRA